MSSNEPQENRIDQETNSVRSCVTRSPRILISAPYSTEIASTRIRASYFSDFCKSKNISVRFITALDSVSTRWWLSGGSNRLLALPSIVKSIITSLVAVRRSDCIVVQRECVPLNFLLIEKFAIRRGIPLIWDIDDALWHNDCGRLSWLRGSKSKYQWLARYASATWTGSTVSKQWISQSATQPVYYVPTALPTQQRLERVQRKEVTLVWVGTPSAAPNLERLVNRIGERLKGFQLIVVGAQIISPKSMNVECIPWSLESEHRVLSEASVGIYPMEQSDFNDGKSAGKAVLYMTYGIPQVASISPPLLEVLSKSEAAFIVRSDDDWINALEILKDPLVRLAMGEKGRAYAEENFNILQWSEWRLASLELILSKHKR